MLIVCLPAIILPNACVDSTPAPDLTASSDPAVLTIALDTTNPPIGTIASEPAIRIGDLSQSADHQLFEVSVARRLANGDIAIANNGSGEIRVYGSDGSYRRAIGRRGEGPGEFRHIFWLEVVGDTLFAYDFALMRVTAFSYDGQAIATINLQAVNGFPFEERLADSRTRNGEFLIPWDGSDIDEAIKARTIQPGQIYRNRAALLRYSPEGTLVDTVANLAGRENAYITYEGGSGYLTQPFNHTLTYTVAGDYFYVGTQETNEIIRWSTARS